MTIIPPENQDRRIAGSPSEIPHPPETVESVSQALRERIGTEVSRFEEDTTARLGGVSQAEANLSPSDVSAVREKSGLAELPGMIREVHALGDHAMGGIERTAKSVMSPRALRALGREGFAPEVAEVEIPHTPPARVEPASEALVSAEGQEVAERRESSARLPTEVLRLQRDLDLADAMDRLERGESLRPREVEMLAGALEGRGWQKLCSEVRPGDGLATFLVPNAKQFSIKYFNDVLFGMQRTDDVIKYRRDILMREVGMLDIERVATSYKDEQYRIPKERLEADGKERIKDDLVEAGERIRYSMSTKLAEMAATEWASADETRKQSLDEFAESLIGASSMEMYREHRTMLIAAHRAWEEAIRLEAKAFQQLHAAGSDQAEARMRAQAEYDHAKQLSSATYDQMALEALNLGTRVVAPALKQDSKLGYRMTFGIGEVGAAESDVSLTHIERAVSESTKTAMAARHGTEGGSFFTKEIVDREIADIMALRDRIGIQELTDAEGRVYPIFETRPDGKGMVVSVMNLDLIREIRKGSFKVAEDPRQRVLYQSVAQYIGAINLLDVTKPYVHEELAGGTLHGTNQTVRETIDETRQLSRRLREGGVSTSEREAMLAILKSDAKDRACSSMTEFHQKSLEISNCSYISLDVLDVGPELLQEYELLIQRVANGRMTFDEAQLKAGDATTKKMREFRARVLEAYRELCHGEEPLMSVGGDEVVLAMDTAKVTDAFMLKLRGIKLSDREGGSVRVVKTAVGSGERRSKTDGDARKKEHLEAIKRAEDGTAAAKEIEKTVRRIRASVYDLPRGEREAEFEALKRMNIETFAVHQREGADGFELILKDPESDGSIRANLEGKMEELAELSAGLKQRVELRRQAFYDEFSKTHPKLTKELVPIALRRKDQNMEGFEHFMNALIES